MTVRVSSMSVCLLLVCACYECVCVSDEWAEVGGRLDVVGSAS